MWRVIAGSAAYGRPISCKPEAALPRGHLRARHRREEAVASMLDVARQQRRFDRAADHPRAPAQNGDRRSFAFVPGSSSFSLAIRQLSHSAWMLPAVEPRALLGQSMRHRVRQRQVDVVAAQQNVLADRHAVQREFAVRFA